MARGRGALRRAVGALALAGFAACGGGGGGPPSPPPLVVAFSAPPPSSIAIGTTAAVAATVSNDPLDAGLTWTVTCGSADCGTLTPAKTASGAATTYTPPATVPAAPTVTIKATSVVDATQSVSGTTTIEPAGGSLLADGTYVFHLSGTDANGAYTVAGAFSVAKGAITGGEQDFSDPSAGYNDTLVVATSSLNAAGGNLQLVLDTGNTMIGTNGLETIRGTVVSASRLLISEFDPSATATGSVDLQTSVAPPAAGYAFALSGNIPNGNPLAIGGILDFTGTSLSPAGSVFDISVFNTSTNTAGVSQNQTFQSGSVTAPDDFGRVVFTLTPSVASGVSTFAFAGYVVGTNRIELVESGQPGDVFNANTGGSALGQGANTGTFTATSDSVINQSYAHGSSGFDANDPATMAGGFDLGAGGVLGGRLAVNDSANAGAWTMGGSYAVDPTGRVTVSVTSLTSATAPPPAPTLAFELYLDGNGNAMVIGADAFETTQGIAFEQGGGTFELSGSYALSAQGTYSTSSSAQAWGAVGPVAVNGTTFSGYTDYTAFSSTPQAEVPLAGTWDEPGGLLQLNGLYAVDFQETNGYGYYPLNDNGLWGIQVNRRGLSLLLLEPVTP